jgi:adenylate cyclase
MFMKNGKNNPVKNSVDEVFYQQLLLSERLRVQILISFLILLMLVVIGVFLVFREEYLSVFKGKENLPAIVVTLGFFIIYEFAILSVISYFIKSGRNYPTFGRYGNSIFEVSIPTISMIILTGYIDPAVILNSPASFGYFLFIILSTLRLDFRLSFITGLAAALELIGMNIYYRQHFGLNTSAFSFYMESIGKGLFLLFCGTAAGFVSLEIRRRVYSTLRLVDERNKIINVFSQQVSPEIAEELILRQDELTGTVRDVCVMFLDIRNFTSMVEKKNPKEIVAYQDAVFGMAIDIITKHKGIINQFLGDGFMATFGAPVYRGNDCQNAVNAALEIISELNEKKQESLLLPTRVGIGIHYGEAVTGNVGTSARKQYSITGNVVILASRLEQLNKEYNSQLIISREVLDHINLKPGSYEALGKVVIKGRNELMEIYKIC